MNSYEWKDAEHDTYYYFNKSNGKIIGQVHKITHTKVWHTKVYTNIYNEELYLGIYVSCETAKDAIENHMAIQERTLLE